MNDDNDNDDDDDGGDSIAKYMPMGSLLHTDFRELLKLFTTNVVFI